MNGIIARKELPSSDFCSILRGNAQRAYDALRLASGNEQPLLRLRGEREWALYGLQETAKTMPASGSRFLPVRLRREKHEPCTELVTDPEAPALVGWSATRLAMLSKDQTTALSRVGSAWAAHFVGFRLAKIEIPAGIPLELFRSIPVEVVQGGPVLYLEHYATGLVRFEMP